MISNSFIHIKCLVWVFPVAQHISNPHQGSPPAPVRSSWSVALVLGSVFMRVDMEMVLF